MTRKVRAGRRPLSACARMPGMVPRTQRQPFNPLSVEGPMARNVADMALMFDAEAGWHRLDPLSQVGPHPRYAVAAARPRKPLRVAFSADLGVARAVDREVREISRAAAEKLARDGVTVEETHPDFSGAERTFQTLRGAVFVGRHAALLEKYRDLYKPEIIENTEFGLRLTPREIVEAEIAQGELVRRVAAFFDDYDLLLCPTVTCPPPFQPAPASPVLSSKSPGLVVSLVVKKPLARLRVITNPPMPPNHLPPTSFAQASQLDDE